MSTKNLLAIFRNYKKTSQKKRQAYLRDFEKKMLYRTTKTENPETTKRMIKKVLDKVR